MTNSTNRNIVIWAYGKFVEIANEAVLMYQSMYSPEATFQVVDMHSSMEIYERLTDLNEFGDESSNEWPNILLVHDEELKQYVKEFPGLFQSLDNLDTSMFMSYKLANVTYQNGIYGFPCSSYPVALYYRKDILNGNGMTFSDNLTWDDFIQMGEELKETENKYLLAFSNNLTQILMQSTGQLYYDAYGNISSAGAEEVLTLVDDLRQSGVAYPQLNIPDELIIDLMLEGQIVSIIGAPWLFTMIKDKVAEIDLWQEWGVARIPKSEVLTNEVNLGGYSWMVLDKGEDNDQELVFDFLGQMFGNNQEMVCKLAESDIVPVTCNAWLQLNDLDNNGCFYNQQVIKFLAELGAVAPEIYYGTYTNELTQNLTQIATQIAEGTISVNRGYSDFEDLSEYYFELAPPPVLERIEICEAPIKTEYYKYENFDSNGMIVHAYFTDGTDRIVYDYVCSPLHLELNTSSVVISYSSGGVTKTAEQAVSVSDRNIISIQASSKNSYYFYEDTLVNSDFDVWAEYNVGDSGYIHCFNISPTVLNEKVVEKEIRISCTENTNISCMTTINIIGKLTEIVIESPPYKTKYIEDTYFEPNGMQVLAKYNNGESKIITNYSFNTDKLLKEENSITISYTENGIAKIATQTITVQQKKLERIEVNGLKKTKYLIGDMFDPTGLSVTAYYNNGTSEIVSNYEVESSNERLDSESTVKIHYTENEITCEAAISITVLPKVLTGLRVVRRPDKLRYQIGDSISPLGMVLYGQYSNSIWEEVNGYDSFEPGIFNEEGNIDVTVKYSEGGIEQSAKFSVTVEKEGLQTIQVSNQPSKRRYYVGEEFNQTGMTIVGQFSDGNKQNISNGEISVTSTLKYGDKYVKAYYHDANNVKTHSTRIAVTVLEKDVDNAINGQAELNYSCGAGEARVNLFHGRLAFEHFDVDIGSNSYNIACSHIYNSMFSEETSLKYGSGDNDYYRTYMGKGFKLSVQQYLIYDQLNSRYIYTDALGYRHSFVSVGDGHRYYDTTGTDLLLKQEDNQYLIYDSVGNKMYFKDGVLVKSISCFNTQQEKYFNYNTDGQISEIFDGRQPNNKIVFEYDQITKLLVNIKCKQANNVKRTIGYSYAIKGSKYYLTQITDGDEHTVFYYNSSGNLINVVELETKSCLKFGYTSSLVSEVVSGVATLGVDAAGNVTSINIEDENVKERNIISGDSNRFSVSVRNQKSRTKNDYKDIIMMYYFNAQGNTTAVLEVNEGKTNDLRSPDKLPGTEVKFDSQRSKTSDQINTRAIYDSFTDNRYFTSSNNEELSNYRKSKCNNFDNFTVGFWVKLNRVLLDPHIQVIVSSQNTIFSSFHDVGDAVLDNSAIGVWQFVTVPVRISGDNINGIEVLMVGDYNDGVSISDMRLYSSSLSRWFIKAANEEAWAPIDTAEKLSYTLANSNSSTTEDISESCFVTEKDIQSTIFNMYQERIDGQKLTSTANFILSLCNGTRKLWVKEASLYAQNIKNESNDFRAFPIAIEAFATTDDEPAHGLGLFNFEMISPDGLMTSYGYMKIYPSMTIGNYTGDVIREHTIAKTQGENSKTSETNTYADFLGRTLKEVDEYGLTYTYEYDADGEVCKKIVSHQDTEETIVYETLRDSASVEERTQTSYNKIVYNNLLGHMEATQYHGNGEADSNTLQHTYEYDVYGRRLQKVFNNLGGQNVLSYNNGRLHEVSPTGFSNATGYGYRIEYDHYGDPNKYFLLNGINKAAQLLTEKETDYSIGRTITKQYRHDETHPDTITVTLDKYGRTSSIKETSYGEDKENRTRFERQDLWESAGASEVTEMYDPYEDRTYTYSYDEYNKCSGYSGASKIGDFSVQKTEANAVTYYKGTAVARKSEINYDEDRLISPRINNVNDMSGRLRIVGENVEKTDIGKISYTYDKLGRIEEKKILATYIDFITVHNSYLTGTTLKNNITVSCKIGSEDYARTFNYIYDSRGRITHVNSSADSVADFTYDIADRLVAEKLPSGQMKTFEYNADGSVKSEQIAEDTKINYVYEKGRLVTRGDMTFSYDNFGNCTNYNGTALEWHRGNLLKQFGSGEQAAHYQYDAQGIRFEKVYNGVTTRYFHDGAKIIDEVRGNTRIRYLYDAEELIGFYAKGNYYYFVKDGLGNVRSILCSKHGYFINKEIYELNEVARYDYDAWGNCTVTELGTETIDGVSVANFNPIRWKSEYYDVENGLYYIDGRYYSPEIKQYISAINVETVVANAATVYGLNPYLVTLDNCVNKLYNGYTIETNTPLVYDPPQLNKWDQFWKSTLGKVFAGILVVAALGLCGFTGNIGAFLVTAGMTIGSLMIGASIAGYQSYVSGKGFWRGFERYIGGNWAQSAAIASISLIVTIGVNMMASAFRNAGGKCDLPNAECFIAGTLVLCMDEDGNQCHKPIEDVKVGDMVWAYDEETGENAWKPVVRLFRNQTKEWYHVFVDGEEIVCTAEHPFYVVDKGFVPARTLKADDKLLLANGKQVAIDKIEIESLAEFETTYNFEVADFHTYYVAESNVLVHNKCKETFDQWLNKGESNNQVYRAIDEITGKEVYTGITRQKLETRLWQHKRGGKKFKNLNGIYKNLTRNQARAIETYLIRDNPLQNKMWSISRHHRFFNQAMDWAKMHMGL